jgi:hypothetical protein
LFKTDRFSTTGRHSRADRNPESLACPMIAMTAAVVSATPEDRLGVVPSFVRRDDAITMRRTVQKAALLEKTHGVPRLIVGVQQSLHGCP